MDRAPVLKSVTKYRLFFGSATISTLAVENVNGLGTNPYVLPTLTDMREMKLLSYEPHAYIQGRRQTQRVTHGRRVSHRFRISRNSDGETISSSKHRNTER